MFYILQLKIVLDHYEKNKTKAIIMKLYNWKFAWHIKSFISKFQEIAN